MLSTITAIVILGEHPSAVALVGTVLIGLGIVVITGNPFKLAEPTARKPMIFAILCGTAMGARLLSEGNIKIRLIDASAMVIGLGALSIG